MDVHAHWERLFRSTPPEAFSWFRPHLDISLDLIEHAAPDRSSAIIDVGAGESTLVDDLIERGYRNITVLDISETALELTQKRLGTAATPISSTKCRQKATSSGKPKLEMSHMM